MATPGREQAERILDLVFGRRSDPLFVKTDREFIIDAEVDRLFLEKRRELQEKGLDISAAAEVTRWASAYTSGFVAAMLGPEATQEQVREGVLRILPRALGWGEIWHTFRRKRKESPLAPSEIKGAERFGTLCALLQRQGFNVETLKPTPELMDWLEGL